MNPATNHELCRALFECSFYSVDSVHCSGADVRWDAMLNMNSATNHELCRALFECSLRMLPDRTAR
jgi:hypothetical protein